MRLAVLSDIHGNLLALEAVLADLEAQGGAAVVVIAGDLCADGPRPREVLERVRALGYPVIQGNTDRDLTLSPEDVAESEHAERLNWTREQIGAEGLDYLRALPFSHRVPEPEGHGAVLIVHANPRDLDTAMRPLASDDQLLPLLADVPDDVTTIVFGHVHIPYVRRVGRLLLADIASVGLPKDGDRRAGYGLLTWQGGGWAVEQRRVEYPVDAVVLQLREANPPHALEQVRLLLRARYPNMTEARGGRLAPRRGAQPAAAKTAANDEAVVADAITVGGELVVLEDAVSTVPTPEPSPTNAAGDEPAAAAADLAPVAPPSAPQDFVGEVAENQDPLSGEEIEPFLSIIEAPGVEETALAVAGEAPADADDAADDAPAKEKGKRGRKKGAGRAPKGTPTVAMEPTTPFVAVLPVLLQERMGAVLAQREAVHADEDPEAVHDMRVAIRRLRAALDAAAPFYGAQAFRRQERRARRLARALGEVRDQDVHLEFLRERVAAAAPDERAGLEGLIAAIGEERDIALADLAVALGRWDDRSRSHAAAFRRFTEKTKGGRGRSRETVATVAARALSAKVAAFEECAAIFADPDGGSAEEFHLLRIAAKRLRYALELFSPILGGAAADAIGELRSLQDRLGLMHDRDVFGELIAWERAEALERELHMLEYATLNPGTRDERLAAVREQLSAPASFAVTAPGIYGLLIDVNDERDQLEAELREHWATLAEGFLGRLRALAEPVQPAAADLTIDAASAGDSESTTA